MKNIPRVESNCKTEETIDIGILIAPKNCDRKFRQPIRTTI